MKLQMDQLTHQSATYKVLRSQEELIASCLYLNLIRLLKLTFKRADDNPRAGMQQGLSASMI